MRYDVNKLDQNQVQDVLNNIVAFPHQYYLSVPELNVIRVIKDDDNAFEETFKTFFKQLYKVDIVFTKVNNDEKKVGVKKNAAKKSNKAADKAEKSAVPTEAK